MSFVDRALAAVSQGPVLHAVLELPTTETWVTPDSHPSLAVVDLATGHERPMMSELEIWYDPNRQSVRQVNSVDGTIQWESLQTPTGDKDNLGHSQPADGPPSIDPGLAAFFKGYRQALADGSAIDMGSGSVDGRDVEWLRFPATSEYDVAEEIAVDRSTYQAVALRAAVCPKCTAPRPIYSITSLEGISRARADFTAPMAHNPHPVALYGASYNSGEVNGATVYLGQQAYWAGEVVGGVAFSGVEYARAANYSTNAPTAASLIATGHGTTFYYGTPSEPRSRSGAAPVTPSVSIAETADVGFAFHGFNMEELSTTGDPLSIGRAALPPEGQMVLGNTGGLWVGQMRKGQLYIEIESNSRALALDAARSLVPTT
jgi:hypothetical protein